MFPKALKDFLIRSWFGLKFEGELCTKYFLDTVTLKYLG